MQAYNKFILNMLYACIINIMQAYNKFILNMNLLIDNYLYFFIIRKQYDSIINLYIHLIINKYNND